MKSQDKLEILRNLKEDRLIDEVIVPLLEKMGFKNITKTHRQSEKGIDLVFYRQTEFGDIEYTGIQVKTEKIHGSAGKSGNATEILTQAQQAFCHSFCDIRDGKQKNIDKFIVMTSDDIIPSAQESIEDQLKRLGYYKSIRFFDGKKLVELIDEYMPSFFWEEYEHFNKYFNAMKQEFETIEDVTALGQREPIPLEDVYVSLRLSEKREHEIPMEKEMSEAQEYESEELERRHPIGEKAKREQVFDADEAVKRFDRVVIVGVPGSGKTTLMKHVALKSCKENLEKKERTIVPILIELRPFSESGKSLREYIDDVFEKYDFPKAKKSIEKDLKEGRCQLLLDGFDELVTKEKQREIAEHVEAFIRKYHKNRFIVTSRIAGYNDELKGFQKLEIMEFTDQQIEAFVMNWFGETNPEKAKSMSRTIRENEKIMAIARNPLMITIVAIIYEEDRELPQRRVELYQRCVEVLLSKWDVRHRIKNVYEVKAKEKILRKLGLEFHAAGKRTCEKAALLKVLSGYLPEVRIQKEKAEDVLNEIVKRNALLKEVSIGVYGFLHLSFQEYFTALELRERKDYETLLNHVYEPWWEEVVLLFAGFDRDAAELIRRLREKEKTDERFREDIFYSNLILMGKCIADADYTESLLRDEITAGLWKLYQTTKFSLTKEKAIKVLGLIKPEKIIDSLIEELKNEETYVRERAAIALGTIGSEKAVDPLLKALTTDESSDVRERAAIALGTIGSEKAVDPLLKALTTDESSNVRERAAYALGTIGSEKAVDPLLKALTTDESSYVRGRAAIALGTIGSEKAVDPLLKALKDRGQGIFGEVKDAAFSSLEKISKKTKIRITDLT